MWAQWWGRLTPPLVIHQLKTLLQIVLKFLFIVAKYFFERKYARLQLRMQLKMKCENRNAENKYEITTDLPNLFILLDLFILFIVWVGRVVPKLGTMIAPLSPTILVRFWLAIQRVLPFSL